MNTPPPAIAPHSLAEALTICAADPERVIVNGGTDIMVGVNSGRCDVDRWLSLRNLNELRSVTREDSGRLTLGSGVRFADLAIYGAMIPPALMMAARTIGSAQIRSSGTLGGNIATASPAADSVPPLLCHDAELELRSAGSVRRVPLEEFATGPKSTVLRSDEIITGITLASNGGVEWFAKVGTRNAMVISVCSLAARLDPTQGVGRVAIGSAAPTVRRIPEAEASLLHPHGEMDFAEAVMAACSPIDDQRATANYRRHALGVLARRVHHRLWEQIKETTR